jgi:hypothetical protein
MKKIDLINHHKKQIAICVKKLETANPIFKESYVRRIRTHKEELKRLQPTLADFL